MPRQTLLICDSFPEEMDHLFMKLNNGTSALFSSVIFSRSLIKGFEKTQNELFIVSGPSIGHYPITSKTKFVPGQKYSDHFYGVHYNNLIGLSSLSKENAIVNAFRRNIKKSGFSYDIVISEAHLPFMNAALRIKKMCPGSTITLICMDLPGFVEPSKKNHFLSSLQKKNQKLIEKKYKEMDGFAFLTEDMNSVVNKLNKPYFVQNGIVDDNLYFGLKTKPDDGMKKIVYAGSLYHSFGIDLLLKAFSLIKEESFRLILIGKGDAVSLIEETAKKDSRIVYQGERSSRECLEEQLNATVLVNPRTPENEFTKYSFPSKTFSYLAAEKPFVAYRMPSFSNELADLLITPTTTSPKDLAEALEKAAKTTLTEDRLSKARQYLHNYTDEAFAQKLITLFSSEAKK